RLRQLRSTSDSIPSHEPAPPAPAPSRHLAEAVPPAPGAPLAGELRCRCVQAVTEVIPPRRLAGLELVPAGPHCAVPEVIATTKAGRTLCLSPSAPWVQLLAQREKTSSNRPAAFQRANFAGLQHQHAAGGARDIRRQRCPP
uniref:Chemokine interleukin-8-like domain-containing protein n=1 Tax=Anser brachyrhynchus TaxID=132585 RepID=A0A8B9BQM0_9AVES